MTTSRRPPAVRLKNARKHSASSQRWLLRQLNDPFVAEARKQGYRSRAAFKLSEIDDKYKIFRKGQKILDLGCAPGGWLQIALERTGENKEDGPARIVGVDLLEVIPIPGATLIQGNFLEDAVLTQVLETLGGQADVVLSDMAASATGHAATDHLKIMALLDAAYLCAVEVLSEGGAFVGKVLQGGAQHALLTQLKHDFQKVVHFKPKSSRKESAEMYVVALGFRRANLSQPLQGEVSE